MSLTLTPRDAEVDIEVRDNGPGFPPELLPRATERFARGDSSRSRATGGSGLGLAIVKAVTDAHGGALVVTNAPDGGGLVRITLPASGAATATPDLPQPVPAPV